MVIYIVTWSDHLRLSALRVYLIRITTVDTNDKVVIQHITATTSTTTAPQHNQVAHLCLLHLIFPQTAQLWPNGNSSCWYDCKRRLTYCGFSIYKDPTHHSLQLQKC